MNERYVSSIKTISSIIPLSRVSYLVLSNLKHNRSSNVYKVTVLKEWKCTCQDFYQNSVLPKNNKFYCKHILAVKLYKSHALNKKYNRKRNYNSCKNTLY